MKIIEGTGAIIPQSKKKQPKTEPGDGDFRKVMDQAKGKDGQKARRAHSAMGPDFPPGGIQMTVPAKEISKSGTVDEVRQTALTLEKTLDLLDFYAVKLGDPTLKLTEISPMIDHLEDRLQGLEKMTSSTALPDSLKTLLDDTMTIMGTEIAKFKRGDYA